MTDQIGLYSFKLTQKRYQEGAFYLSVILVGEQAKALDGRFYVEEGNELTPTKNGFRIPLEILEDFKKVLAGDLRAIDDRVLIKNKSFHFHVRYLNDKYGEAIDFRKYKTTNKYTGWDRSGIRMKLEDVVTIRDWLAGFDSQAIDPADNIFVGKVFRRKEHDKGSDHGAEETAVSSAIKDLLDF